MEIIIFGFFVAMIILFFLGAAIFVPLCVIGSLLMQVVVTLFWGVLALIGIVILWQFLKKNKEIKERMKRQAMHR